MRTLGLGFVVLGFALVLLSWDASRRFAFVRTSSQSASFETGRHTRVDLSVTPAPASIGREAEVPRPAVRGSDPVTYKATKRATPPGVEARQKTPQTAPRLREVPDFPVREFAPGSKAHAVSIASSIATNEYRNAVEPLARLYFALFDRVADYDGLNNYIDERHAGVSLESIADEFAGSPELRLRYGALDNAAFVDRIYRNVFDALPDSAQRAYWVGQLDAGMSRGNVILAFSESGAFRTATTNEVFVTMAYAETLRQAPEPAEFARWVRFLDAGHSREAVIAGLLGGARRTR